MMGVVISLLRLGLFSGWVFRIGLDSNLLVFCPNCFLNTAVKRGTPENMGRCWDYVVDVTSKKPKVSVLPFTTGVYWATSALLLLPMLIKVIVFLPCIIGWFSVIASWMHPRNCFDQMVQTCSKIQPVKFPCSTRHVLFLVWLRAVEICTSAIT